MKEVIKKIYSDRFRWFDSIIIVAILSFVMVVIGQISGEIIVKRLSRFLDQNDPAVQTGLLYLATIGVWIVGVLWMFVFKHRRPILKALTPKAKGNTFKMLGVGLLIGFGLNFTCALVAMLNKDIHVYFAEFNPLIFLWLFICVFIQSSSEELVERAYILQTWKKGYRNKWVAIIGNSILFSLMHTFNPGVTKLALANIFLSGVLCSLAVYYYDSIWMAFGIHTAWNFTQSILLGLPNSGLVVPYSIFMLDTANANNSFVYNILFGIEGTIFSTILLAIACVVMWRLGEKRNQEPLDVYAES